MKTVWLVFAMVIGNVLAGPVPVGTKSEVQKAKGVIDDLVESGVDAEKLVSMAAETEKGPERFWLYSNAFILQTKDGKFAEATETLKALQQNVTDIPEINIINLIERNVGKKIAEAPELAAILKESKTRLAAQRLVAKLKQDIRKNPKAAALKASLGEALAVCGDWKAALEAFAEAQGKVSGIAKAELESKRTMKIAAFWWDYQTCHELASSKAFKAHAVGIYTELLKGDQLSVVEKTLAESRVAQFSDDESGQKTGESPSVGVTEKTLETDKPSANEINDSKMFCVIDVAKGPNAKRYAVTYIAEEPKTGWTQEDKTKKIVLRKVKAGIDPLGRYTISKDYYVGVFEISQKQWEYVMGSNPAENKCEYFPITMISTVDIRGVQGGHAIGKDGFAAALSERTGLIGFDLPSEAQWDYANRVGATSKLGGNVWERCRDNGNPLLGKDPVGDTSGKMVANCSWKRGMQEIVHARTNLTNPLRDRGFRIVLNLK